jgi:MFS family permease
LLFVLFQEGEFSWSMETQGHILASYYYGYVATQLLGGYAAARWGGKVVVGPAVAATGVLSVMSPAAARRGGPWALIAVRVLQGACSVSGPLPPFDKHSNLVASIDSIFFIFVRFRESYCLECITCSPFGSLLVSAVLSLE